jgi:hypothetical protein
MQTNPFKASSQSSLINTPVLDNIRQLKGEIDITNDNLRDLLCMILCKLNITDLKYALLTMEYEYDRRRHSDMEVA